MRRFYLDRAEDVSGNSGTGRVAEGIQFSDGAVVVHWVPSMNALRIKSTVVYGSLDDAVAVHGYGGKTRVEWVD